MVFIVIYEDEPNHKGTRIVKRVYGPFSDEATARQWRTEALRKAVDGGLNVRWSVAPYQGLDVHEEDSPRLASR